MTGFEIAIISLAAAGTGIAAYSQYQQGKAASEQARAEAAWHQYNAKVAEREAEAERQATAFEIKQHKRESEQLLARQRAVVGKSGVTMEGSPLLVAEDTAEQLALERSMISITGERRAARFRSQSILDITKAGMAKSAAAGYKRAGYMAAGTTLLGGVADVGFTSYELGMWGKKKAGKKTE